MTIRLIQSDSEFLDLKDEWNTLLKDSASHVPFLRHEYLFNWWKTLGGGEWNQGKLTILIERDQNNKLTGAAPLFLADHQVMFLGSEEISDYLDLISTVENLPNFIDSILHFMNSKDFPEWDSLFLKNILDTSPSIKYLSKAAEDLGLDFSHNIIQPAPYLRLPGSWSDYLDQLEDRYSHEIRRKLRKAETYFLPIDWYAVTESETVASELVNFLELMANNPEKDAFLTEEMSQHLIDSALSAFQEGWLQLVFLTVGDLKVAGYLNFDFDGKIWVYNSGINNLFENLSPGWVLLSYLIQWAIQEGKSEIDFMRGDEPYKYQFGAIDKDVVQLMISK